MPKNMPNESKKTYQSISFSVVPTGVGRTLENLRYFFRRLWEFMSVHVEYYDVV